jgi:hypothetical protein
VTKRVTRREKQLWKGAKIRELGLNLIVKGYFTGVSTGSTP